MSTANTAEDTVLHSFDAQGPLHIDAQLRNSSLHVAAAETDQITVEVTLAKGVHINADPTEVIVDYSANTLRIEVPENEGGGLKLGPIQIGNFTSHRYRIDVEVPAHSSLNAHTGSGSITASGLLEKALAKCGSGRVSVEQAREVDVRTGSGAITVGQVERMEAIAGSGGITVDTVAEAHLTAGSGGIRVSSSTGHLQLKTGSGDIRLGIIAGASALAGSGNIEVAQLSGDLNAKTGSGDVTVQRAVSGVIHTTAASGDVTVGVPSGTAVLQDCSTISGRLSSELQSTEAPAEAQHRLELHARTVSGNIALNRAG